mgnify:CR=1 FL=1
MKFEVFFESNVQKEIAKLKDSKRIFQKIEQTRENPFRYFIRLKSREEYKLRIGNTRIIAIITKDKILIQAVGHRRNIYEKYYKLKEASEEYGTCL